VRYVKPSGDVVPATNGRLERIDLGAAIEVTRDGEKVATMRSRRSFFPSQAPEFGPVSRFFEGERRARWPCRPA
jgi:cytochrome c-type biogenesis protein CcmF